MDQDSQRESQLVRQLLAGERRRLADVFAIHRDRLWRMVHFRIDGRIASRVDPEDVLQEAYIDAAARLDHYQAHPDVPLFIWLRQIVIQTLANVHRRHLATQSRNASRQVSLQTVPSPTTSVSLTAMLIGQVSSPSKAAMRDEMANQVKNAIEAMDEIDREVIALRHFEELTNKEVAGVLNLEEKAASIRYVRALARLKRILETIPGMVDEGPLRIRTGDE